MNIDFFINQVNDYFGDNEWLKNSIVEKIDIFGKYVDVVVKWNKKINITGFNENRFIFSGVLEPLLILKRFSDFKESITDIGAGSGIPSVTLSIFFPETNVNIIEVNKKKLSFLKYVKYMLGLENVFISKNPPVKSNIITSRAFKNIYNFKMFMKQHNICSKYVFLFFKGDPPENQRILYRIDYKNPFNQNKYSQCIYPF